MNSYTALSDAHTAIVTALSGDDTSVALEAEALAVVLRDTLAHVDRMRREAIARLAVAEGVRETARRLSLSPARVSRIANTVTAWGDTAETIVRAMTPAEEYAATRDAVETARIAQGLRAEAFSGGNVTELKAFYRSVHAPVMDGSEAQISMRTVSAGIAGQTRQREIHDAAVFAERSAAVKRGLERKAQR